MLLQNWFQPFQVSCQVWEAVAVLPAVRVSSASSHFVQISILLRQQFAKTDISDCAIYCTFYLLTDSHCLSRSEYIRLSKQGMQRSHGYDACLSWEFVTQSCAILYPLVVSVVDFIYSWQHTSLLTPPVATSIFRTRNWDLRSFSRIWDVAL